MFSNTSSGCTSTFIYEVHIWNENRACSVASLSLLSGIWIIHFAWRAWMVWKMDFWSGLIDFRSLGHCGLASSINTKKTISINEPMMPWLYVLYYWPLDKESAAHSLIYWFGVKLVSAETGNIPPPPPPPQKKKKKKKKRAGVKILWRKRLLICLQWKHRSCNNVTIRRW